MRYIIVSVVLVALASSIPLEDASLGAAKENDVLFYFYSRTHPDGLHVTSKEVNDTTHIRTVFNSSHPTVVLIHGWKDGYGSDSNTFIREAILSTTDANIIKVDWSVNAGKLYVIAKNAVPSVGKWTGEFLDDLTNEFQYPYDNITIVGFSLGAHVAGNVGKYFNGELPLIVGLDPAGPLISAKDTSFCLNTADAKYVQVIHTDAGSAGMADVLGHSDFYPNDGKSQPGCSGLGCSHNRAWALYAESIKDNKFVAQQCSSYNNYVDHDCNGSHTVMGGINIDTTVTGVYYLTTNSEEPFGRGEE